jgi:hypothetical protein
MNSCGHSLSATLPAQDSVFVEVSPPVGLLDIPTYLIMPTANLAKVFSYPPTVLLQFMAKLVVASVESDDPALVRAFLVPTEKE